jgi:hypothetical protein
MKYVIRVLLLSCALASCTPNISLFGMIAVLTDVKKAFDTKKELKKLNDQLCIAAEMGDLDKVKGLLALNVNPNAPQSAPTGTIYLKCTPLMLAAHRGLHQVVWALLEAGADANRKDALGAKALRYAYKGLAHEVGWIEWAKKEAPDIYALEWTQQNSEKNIENLQKTLGILESFTIIEEDDSSRIIEEKAYNSQVDQLLRS